jgi:PAS domain S-box-containing protein
MTTEPHFDELQKLREENERLRKILAERQILDAHGSAVDNSRFRDLEETIEKRNICMRLAADSANFGVWEFDFLTGKFHVDNWMAHLYGLDMETEPTVQDFMSKVHHKDLPHLKNAISNVLESSNEFFTEFRIFPEAGIMKYIRTNAVFLRNSIGELIKAYGVDFENTSQKLTEKSLTHSKITYKTLFDFSPIGIFLLDKNGIILEANQEIENMLQYSKQEMLGRHISMVSAPENIPLIDANIQHILNGSSLELQVLNYKKDGSTCTVLLHETSILLPDGKLGILTVSHDISQKVLIDNRLEYETDLRNLLVEFSSQFINIHFKDIIQAINYSLARIGKFVNADRSYIFVYDFTNKTAKNNFEWCNNGVKSYRKELLNINLEPFNEFIKLHKKGKTVHIKSPSEINNEALLHIMKIQKVESILTVPLMKKKECVGFIGFDMPKSQHEFSIQEQQLFQVYAQLITNIMARVDKENDLLRAKETAELERANLESIIENNADFIWAIDRDYNLLYINMNMRQAYLDNFGIELNAGDNKLQILPKKYRFYWQSLYERAFNNESFTFEDRLVVNGIEKYLQLSLNPIFIEKEVVGVSCFGRDTTKRKQDEIELGRAKEAAEKSEKMYRFLFDNAVEGIFRTDLAGNVIHMNRALMQILGFDSIEAAFRFINRPDSQIWLFPEKRDKYVEYLKDAKIVNDYHTQFIKQDETIIWVAIYSRLITDAETNELLIDGFIIDITSRKMAEMESIAAKEKAEENEEKYRQIFENSRDVIFIYEVTEDQRYKVVTFNPAEEKYIGNVKQFEGQYIDECIPPYLFNQFRVKYEHCIEAGHLIAYEEEINYGPLNLKMLTQLIPLKNSSGRVYRIIGISHDITENKLLTNQLIEQNDKLTILNSDLSIAKDKAEESDRLKSAFLANMSHEIRTPMNGILGFAYLLKDAGFSDDEKLGFVNIIEKNGLRMLNILNNIIDISKIEAGLMTCNLETTILNSIFIEIFESFKPEADIKLIDLRLILPENSDDEQLITDKFKLDAIIINLVKNALKYTDTGFVEFGYTKKETEYLLYVKDSGIGVAKDRFDAIFERFIQAEINDRLARQGTGLGLGIAKAYVELLGGKIWIDSELGKGSSFYFTIPFQHPF